MQEYNKKQFLLPDGINSMAAVQTKIHEDGRAVLRISDCHQSIKIWNNINNENERDDMIEKLSRLQTAIEELKIAVLNSNQE